MAQVPFIFPPMQFTPSEFAAAVASASDQLKAVQAGLSTLRCPEIRPLRVKLSSLSEASIKELLKDLPSSHAKADKDVDYVYVIRVAEPAADTVSSLRKALTKAREIGGDYCRVIEPCPDTTTLYVGRSKSLKTRLRQHLGAGGAGVYAMHLERWATGIDADLSISYMQFVNQHDLLVQAIEDGIWESLRPAFGRKGGK